MLSRDRVLPRRVSHLTVAQILAYADAHRARTGEWPGAFSGVVRDNPNEKWRNLDNALRCGLRGLEGGSSSAQLLVAERGVRNIQDLPPLTEQQILTWAEAHRTRTGAWPTEHSSPIDGAPGEVWVNVNQALRDGKRGLPGRDSLARLLARGRGVRNPASLPRLTMRQILAWADAHRARTGRWPSAESGVILDATEETWMAIHVAGRARVEGRIIARPSAPRPPALRGAPPLADDACRP
jgi:hypothetical protein